MTTLAIIILLALFVWGVRHDGPLASLALITSLAGGAIWVILSFWQVLLAVALLGFFGFAMLRTLAAVASGADGGQVAKGSLVALCLILALPPFWPISVPLALWCIAGAFVLAPIAGERIRRKLRSGGVKTHDYYRCARPKVLPNHPRVRWRGGELEDAIADRLGELAMPVSIVGWFERMACSNLASAKDRAAEAHAALDRRVKELETMQGRLLDRHLEGAIEEDVFRTRNDALRAERGELMDKLDGNPEVVTGADEIAARVFRLTQNAREHWRGSNTGVRRDLLDVLCLNRRLDESTLTWDWRYPFDVLVCCANQKDGRGGQDCPVVAISLTKREVSRLNHRKRVA